MKKYIFVLLLFLTITGFSQSSVTKFLGIQIDGSKAEMINKLKSKGYTYNSLSECLEGEFNGREVEIRVVTNNNKVYRIFLMDKYDTNESQIKIRFNNLCQQFVNNTKYVSLVDYTIPEDEDISYEMMVNEKSYQAVFFQIHADTDSDEEILKRPVWFTIAEHYGDYKIMMYYDNEYNQANGDDL